MKLSEQFSQAIEHYLQGVATQEQKKLLKEWYDSFDDTTVAIETEDIAYPDFLSQRIKQKINLSIQVPPPVHHIKKSPSLWYKLTAAASICICLSIGAYFLVNNKKANSDLSVNKAHQILPGSNKAILTLSDGSEISLTDTKKGLLATEGQSLVTKSENGELNYSQNDNNPVKVVLNKVSTPKGGQYTIVLPDGTRVWLNAASTLKFPTSFIGEKREVELNGEAYFEVTKNKAVPFHVKTTDQEIEVLGTHFNVNAYADEPATKTTLLEGAVRVYASGSATVTLKPNQQSIFNGQTFQVKTIDTEQAIAWKNGYFMFDNEPLETVMRKLARWYNVAIDYRDNPGKKAVFSGTISRFEKIEEVLKTLELTEMVHFKVEERRIIVMP